MLNRRAPRTIPQESGTNLQAYKTKSPVQRVLPLSGPNSAQPWEMRCVLRNIATRKERVPLDVVWLTDYVMHVRHHRLRRCSGAFGWLQEIPVRNATALTAPNMT